MIFIATDDAPLPNGHYSQAVVAHGLIFVSGQLPLVPGGAGTLPEGIEAQARQVLRNVAAILEAAGGGLSHMVSCSIFLRDMAWWPQVDSVYREALGAHRPARAVFASPQLHLNAMVAMQAIGTVVADR